MSRAVGAVLLGVVLGFVLFILLAVVVMWLTPPAAAAPPAAWSRIPDAEFAPVGSPWPGPTEAVYPVFGPPAPNRDTKRVIEPTARPSAPLVRLAGVPGEVSWYPVPGMVAAAHSWRWGDRPYDVLVCTQARCITVLVQDYCEACVNGRLLDLAWGAFRQLAPLSAGVVRVEVTGWRSTR